MLNRRCQFAMALLCLLLPMATTLGSSGAIEPRLRQMIHAADFKNTQIGVMVVDLTHDRVLAAIRADEPMIPASNMKLITTAAALDVLGPEFAFRTQLSLMPSATPSDTPSLLVKGDGDPAFGDARLLEAHGLTVDDLLDHWVRAVLDTGHTRFEQLLVDDHVFDDQFIHDTWPRDQLHRDYCAQVAGLNFHQNVVDVMLIPSARPGQAVNVELFPAAPFLHTINRATTGDRDQYWVDRRIGSNVLVFGGTVRNTPLAPTAVTVHDPPLFFANVLAERLKQAGVTIGSVARLPHEQMLAQVQPLHVVRTLLPAVLDRTNQDSQNMFAEALLKRMGRAVTGAPGSWDNGAAAVRLSLRNRLGPRSAVVHVADGSGMSRDNRITPRLMVELLKSLHDDANPQRYQLFRNSLSRAGEVGTLSDRMDDLRGSVYAKSGYLREVSALSGYLELPAQGDQPARVVAFSFVFNGFRPPLSNAQMKALQNEFVRTIETALLAPASTVHTSVSP